MGDHVSGNGLQRAKLANRTGSNIETIRYFEKIGTAAGYRVFDEAHVSRLRFILRGRELGFTIAEIRGLLELVDGGTQTCAEVKERTERHMAGVRSKIADLRRIENILAATAVKCSGDAVPSCPILDALAT